MHVLSYIGNIFSFYRNFSDTPQCDCGHDNQTANHIVEECPVRNIPGGMKHLHKVTAAATKWQPIWTLESKTI